MGRDLHALSAEPLRQHPLAAEHRCAERESDALRRSETQLCARSQIRPEGQALTDRKFGSGKSGVVEDFRAQPYDVDVATDAGRNLRVERRLDALCAATS